MLSTGEGYLVTWMEGLISSGGIKFRRVRPDGSMPEECPVWLHEPTGPGSSPFTWPRVTGNGSVYLVTWATTHPENPDLDATVAGRIRSDGKVLDLDPTVLSVNPVYGFPDVTAAEEEFTVVWSEILDPDRHRLFARRMDASGSVLDPALVEIAASTSSIDSPAVAAGTNGYLIAWFQRQEASTATDLLAVRLNRDLETLDPEPIRWSEEESAGTLRMSAAEEQFVAVWSSKNDNQDGVEGALIPVHPGSPDPVLFSAAADAGSNQNFPAGAVHRGGFLVVWRDTRNDGPFGDIYGRFFTLTGETVSEQATLISRRANGQLNVAVSAGLDGYLVVWVDLRHGYRHRSVYGTRVTQAGRILDPDGIQLQPEVSLGQPSLTSDGKNFFAVWSGNRDIEGVVVSGEGEVQPSGVQRVFSGPGTQTVPEAVFFGGRYYVLWEDWESEQIWGRTVNSDGTVPASAPFRISHRDAARNRFPVIKTNGQSLMVLWEEWFENREVDIAAAQIFPGVTPRLQHFSITTDPGEQAAAALDFLQNLYQVYYINRAPAGLPRIKGRGVFVEPVPALENPQMNANGEFTFRLSPGMAGRIVVVETSHNLREWTVLGETDIGPDGEIAIPADDQDGVPARYFRIKMEP